MAQKNILTSNGEQRVLDETKVDSVLSIVFFTIKDFFIWWYIKMTLWHLKMLGRLITIVDDNFSISLLLKNFFLPWRRDNIFIGYIFGVLIKAIYLPIAILAFLLISFVYFGIILVWLVLPLATTYFVINSILSM